MTVSIDKLVSELSSDIVSTEPELTQPVLAGCIW